MAKKSVKQNVNSINPNVYYEDELTDEAVQKGFDGRMFDCHYCKHIRVDSVTCKAFPDGIPYSILVGDVIHNKPIEGDNNIQFKLSDKFERVGQHYREKK